jgi:hypothetical protein
VDIIYQEQLEQCLENLATDQEKTAIAIMAVS